MVILLIEINHLHASCSLVEEMRSITDLDQDKRSGMVRNQQSGRSQSFLQMDLRKDRVSGPGKRESAWVTLSGRRSAIKPSMRDGSDAMPFMWDIQHPCCDDQVR